MLVFHIIAWIKFVILYQYIIINKPKVHQCKKKKYRFYFYCYEKPEKEQTVMQLTGDFPSSMGFHKENLIFHFLFRLFSSFISYFAISKYTNSRNTHFFPDQPIVIYFGFQSVFSFPLWYIGTHKRELILTLHYCVFFFFKLLLNLFYTIIYLSRSIL